MRIKCYVPGCAACRELGFPDYLFMAWRTWSLAPWVCPEHYDLFSEKSENPTSVK
jgi:hypothetical protein